MCWERSSIELINHHPIPEAAIHTLKSEAAPYDSKKRWIYRLANLSGGNFYAALGKERREVTELIRAVNPSSIICYDGDIALRLVDVAQHIQVPLIAYFHGDFRFNFNRWYRWSLENRTDRFAAVIVVTEQERAWMLEHGVPDRNLHVIPCGAPTGIFIPRDENAKESQRTRGARERSDLSWHPDLPMRKDARNLSWPLQTLRRKGTMFFFTFMETGQNAGIWNCW